MIIHVFNENHKYLLFIDLEFFNNKNESTCHLVQFAGLLFQRIANDTYQLMRSCNEYVTDKVCYPFAEYTAITSNFLTENGIPLNDLRASVVEDFLGDIDLDDLLLISHGLKNDRLVLKEADILLMRSKGAPVDGYCTFTNARRILQRQEQLTLADICEEAGYYLHNAHNAYNDVWGEVAVFTYLKKIEEQEKN